MSRWRGAREEGRATEMNQLSAATAVIRGSSCSEGRFPCTLEKNGWNLAITLVTLAAVFITTSPFAGVINKDQQGLGYRVRVFRRL